MNEAPKPAGSYSWIDLSVANAEQIRDFYSAVVGWTSSPHSMGDYDDFCMQTPDDGQTVAGICHARGPNAQLPAQWLIYIHVDDLAQSLERCTSNGGKILSGPRTQGDSQFAVIEDPAGACVALYQP